MENYMLEKNDLNILFHAANFMYYHCYILN